MSDIISRSHPYSAPGRTRTCDPRIRSPLLYPLSYEGVDGVRCRSGRLVIPMGLIAPDRPAVSESPLTSDTRVTSP